MKVVIVEDSISSQKLLIELLKNKYPNIEVVKILDSIKDSIEFFSNNNVDLIFMDIQLKDGYCFKIFNQIDINTPIIFTTAYDNYAIQAFEENSIAYLLKPLDEDKLEHAIKKYNNLNAKNNNSNFSNFLSMINSKDKYKKRFTIKLNDNIIILTEEDIAYFIANDKICYVYTKEGDKYIIDYSLDNLLQQLNPKKFFRISRDCIVTFNAIHKIKKYYNGRLKIYLLPKYTEDIIVSRDRTPNFMKWLEEE